MMALEPMDAFFAARTEGYDEHMLTNVQGCREGYTLMAQRIPENTRCLLDLGCGTGLELDEIFKRFPSLCVTGIDLTRSMLDKLQAKHADKHITLICGDYFSVPLGTGTFDCAVSFETMHHFSRESKLALYKKIHAALQPDGCYIECDYMVDTQDEEDALFAENARLRAEQGIPADAFYHFDTPCTIDGQISMLKAAGFFNVELIFRMGGTAMLLAQKNGRDAT